MFQTHRTTLCWMLAVVMAMAPIAGCTRQSKEDGAGAAKSDEAGAAKKDDAGPAKPTGKLDLSYVTPDAAFAAIAHPRRVLTAPEMEMLPTEVISAAGKKELGIDPLDVEQVMAVAEPPQGGLPPGFGVVVRFSRSYQLDGLLPMLADGMTDGQFEGKPIRRAGHPMAPSLYMPDDRTLIVAPEGFLDKLVSNNRKPEAGPMSEMLSAAGGSHDVLAVLLVEPLRPLAAPALAAVPIPPPFEGVRKVPELISAVEARVTLIGQQSATLIVQARDEAAAIELEQLVDQYLELGEQMFMAQIAQEMDGDDPVEQAMMQYVQRIKEPVLAGLRPVRKGDRFELGGSGPQHTQVATIGILVALILPAFQAAREAARRVQSMNNLKQIGLGMQNHLSALGSFPARASFDAEGKPLLSWRVHLLPYTEHQSLYERFKLDEPWDSEHNSKLIPLMPSFYRNPSSAAEPNLATYLAPVGEGTMFEGREGLKDSDIRDGMSNTIMIVEADDDRAVIWTKPDDWQVDPEDPFSGVGNAHPGGFGALLADGSVHFLSDSIDLATFRALLTYAGVDRVGEFF